MRISSRRFTSFLNTLNNKNIKNIFPIHASLEFSYSDAAFAFDSGALLRVLLITQNCRNTLLSSPLCVSDVFFFALPS